jgi:hypothetical protein
MRRRYRIVKSGFSSAVDVVEIYPPWPVMALRILAGLFLAGLAKLKGPGGNRGEKGDRT